MSIVPESEYLIFHTIQIIRIGTISGEITHYKAVAKWCLSRKVHKPPRGYWQQHYSHLRREVDDPVGAVISGLMTRAQMLVRLVARRSEIEALIATASNSDSLDANLAHPGGP